MIALIKILKNQFKLIIFLNLQIQDSQINKKLNFVSLNAIFS